MMTKHIEQSEVLAKKQLLSSLGVYELRGVARTFGIKSPTTKSRERLIDELALYLATGNLADRRQSNKGRPSKPLARMDEILTAVTNGDEKALSVIFEQMMPRFNMEESANKVLPTKRLSTKVGDLIIGGRNAIETNGQLFTDKRLQSILTSIKQLDCVKVFIGCNLTSEDKLYLNSSDFIYFATDYAEQTARGYDLIIQALSVINERMEKGENIVVIVYDIGRLIFDVDKKFVPDGCEHSALTIKTIKNLISVACENTSGRTTTLLLTYDEGDKADNFLKQDILKVCNKL